jgi:hypothetical protein
MFLTRPKKTHIIFLPPQMYVLSCFRLHPPSSPFQAFFKEAYKARVRKQHDADDGRSYSGRGGRSGGQRPDGWLENLCQVGLVAHCAVHCWSFLLIFHVSYDVRFEETYASCVCISTVRWSAACGTGMLFWGRVPHQLANTHTSGANSEGHCSLICWLVLYSALPCVCVCTSLPTTKCSSATDCLGELVLVIDKLGIRFPECSFSP